MASGTVKWFNATKGYGFIQPDDGSKDVFVHISAVERARLGTQNEGQKIRYEVQSGRKARSRQKTCRPASSPCASVPAVRLTAAPGTAAKTARPCAGPFFYAAAY